MTGPACLVATQLFISYNHAIEDGDRELATKYLDRYADHRERCLTCGRGSVDVETPK